MANYCYNELHVVGDPESVDAFRIVNAQFEGAWAMFRPNTNHEIRALPAGDLLDRRPWPLLSFWPLKPDGNWGTDWTPSGDVDECDWRAARSAWHLPYEQRMARSFGWCFDTSWGPADKWFAQAAERFPTLAMVSAFREGGNGIYGWMRADESGTEVLDCTDERTPWRHARAWAKEQLPAPTEPGALLQAVWADDVVKVRRHASRWNAQSGRWSPLMHAAKAGAQKSFAALLADGHDLSQRSRDGLGVLDILLDIYPLQPRPLVAARCELLRTTLEKAPDLARAPLASGFMPVESATRFRMMGMLPPIIAAGGAAASALGGMPAIMGEMLTGAEALPLLSFTTGALHEACRSRIVLQALRRDDAVTFHQLLRSHAVLPADLIMARGEAPLPKDPSEQRETRTGPRIRAMTQALQAHEAVDATLRAAALKVGA